jgi:hypothetical protein
VRARVGRAERDVEAAARLAEGLRVAAAATGVREGTLAEEHHLGDEEQRRAKIHRALLVEVVEPARGGEAGGRASLGKVSRSPKAAEHASPDWRRAGLRGGPQGA